MKFPLKGKGFLGGGRKLSGVAPIPSFRGASIPLQRQWASLPRTKKIMFRSLMPDYDKDGVPDKWDCRPMNPRKQESNRKKFVVQSINSPFSKKVGDTRLVIKNFLGTGSPYHIRKTEPLWSSGRSLASGNIYGTANRGLASGNIYGTANRTSTTILPRRYYSDYKTEVARHYNIPPYSMPPQVLTHPEPDNYKRNYYDNHEYSFPPVRQRYYHSKKQRRGSDRIIYRNAISDDDVVKEEVITPSPNAKKKSVVTDDVEDIVPTNVVVTKKNNVVVTKRYKDISIPEYKGTEVEDITSLDDGGEDERETHHEPLRHNEAPAYDAKDLEAARNYLYRHKHLYKTGGRFVELQSEIAKTIHSGADPASVSYGDHLSDDVSLKESLRNEHESEMDGSQ